MITPISFLAWLATYAIHSTILLLAALILSRFIANQNAREVLWKTTLLGGFVTSLVASSVGFTPLVKAWKVSTFDPAPPPASVYTASTPSATTPPGTTGSGTPPTGELRSPPGDADFMVLPPGTTILIGAWILVSILLIARLVFRHRRIIRALRDRRSLLDGPLPAMLAELRRKAAVWNPVRLSSAAACPTPIALGRSEICVPERFATDLDSDQQRNALAHELAHLKRRDPLWQMGAGVIESIFFFQPLNVVARRKLREASEYLADDWAVQQTSSPLALARCLTQISSWVGTAPVPDGMLAMAEGGSPLVSRIERLAEWKRSSSMPARVALLASLAIIALVATSAPSFSATTGMQSSAMISFAVLKPGEPVVADSAIRYTGPAGSLAERFAWAMSHNRGGAAWIGWDVEGATVGGTMSTSSTGNMLFGDKQHPSLGSLVGTSPSDSRAGILIRYPSGRAAESEITAVTFMPTNVNVWFGGSSVMWLGSADTKESLALLERLRLASRDPRMRSELAAAYVIHRDPTVVIPGVQKLLQSEGSSDVRSEAIQWLARAHWPEQRVIDVLEDAATRGRDSDERVEAVDGLRFAMEHGSARARAALEALGDNARDLRVRSEALQALTRHTTTR